MYEAKNSKISANKPSFQTIVQKSVCWLLKRWHINRVIDQNIKKLLFFAVFTSYIASILKNLVKELFSIKQTSVKLSK